MKKVFTLLFSTLIFFGSKSVMAQDTLINASFSDSTLPAGWSSNFTVSFKDRNICGGATGALLNTAGLQIQTGAICADQFDYIRFNYGTHRVSTFGNPDGEVRIRISKDNDFTNGFIEIPSGGIQFDTSTICETFSFRLDTFQGPVVTPGSERLVGYSGPLYFRIAYTQGLPGDEHIFDNFIIEGGSQACTLNGTDTANVMATSADIVWTTSSCAVDYLISVTSSTDCGFSNWDTSSTSSPISVGGLSAGELYTAEVWQICGTGDTSMSESITFRASSSCSVPANVAVDGVTDASISVSWSGASDVEFLYGEAGFDPCVVGSRMFASGGTATLTDVSGGNDYEIYVRQVCGSNDTSGWTSKLTASTSPTGFDDLFENFETIRVYPSPANDFVTVSFTPQAGTSGNISIVDVTGRILVSTDFGVTPGQKQEIRINVDGLSDGLYQLFVNSNGQVVSTPVLIFGN